MAILVLLKVPIVHVPAAIAEILNRFDVLAPIDLHESSTRLHEPSRQQATLSETELSEASPHLFRFAFQIKNFA